VTWQNEVALVYQLPDLRLVNTFAYDGEGWGLCDDGSRLVMSDGTDRLYFRDRATFDVLGSVAVRRADGPVTALNELECVDGQVYANVYQTDNIVRIDPVSGQVTAVVSAVTIHPSGNDVGVMNGIAHNPDTGTFLLTGKNWPSLFEVRFVRR
jgi:glutaminyl-peptide cyclotransferase